MVHQDIFTIRLYFYPANRRPPWPLGYSRTGLPCDGAVGV